MKIVKFKQPFHVYALGEVAGFTNDVADNLIKKGYAEEHIDKMSKDAEALKKQMQDTLAQKKTSETTPPPPPPEQKATQPKENKAIHSNNNKGKNKNKK